jgi:hypothetical protein
MRMGTFLDLPHHLFKRILIKVFKNKESIDFEFIPRNDVISNLVPAPKPSKQYIPDWIKNTQSTSIHDSGFEESIGPLRCMPFVDGLSSGYIQELCCTVEIKNLGKENGEDIISYRYGGSIKPMSTRKEDRGSPLFFPKMPGYYHAEFHWNTMWEPKTPKGYSTLYMHPSNRIDLPFTTLSGIIDTDKWQIHGPLPFLIKEGFEGLIPAGTPIYQIMFIKRADWNSSKSSFKEDEYEKMRYSVTRHGSGGYKKEFWNIKKFY